MISSFLHRFGTENNIASSIDSNRLHVGAVISPKPCSLCHCCSCRALLSLLANWVTMVPDFPLPISCYFSYDDFTFQTGLDKGLSYSCGFCHLKRQHTLVNVSSTSWSTAPSQADSSVLQADVFFLQNNSSRITYWLHSLHHIVLKDWCWSYTLPAKANKSAACPHQSLIHVREVENASSG